MFRSIGSVTVLALFMVGCGGGGTSGGGTGGASSPPPPPPPAIYTVGGTVSGLVCHRAIAGYGPPVCNSLTLEIFTPNSSNRAPGPPFCRNLKQIGANGTFTLDSVYPAGYSGRDYVSIAQQPSSPPQDCAISNAKISIQNANDTSVTVSCADHSEYSFVTNAADNTLSSYSVDATTGAVAVIGTPIATGVSPYAIVGGEGYVFVANQSSNHVSPFAVDPTTGALTAVPGSPFAAGTDPQAMVLYASSLLVANAGSHN